MCKLQSGQEPQRGSVPTRERPILFSGSMIRAILENRKTQTRRVVKPQPDFAEQPAWSFGEGHSGKGWYCHETEYPDEGSQFYRCPFGDFGTRLWVRESFYQNGPKQVLYDDDVQVKISIRDLVNGGWERKPSIHMPRWASRITLAIVSVRVERVQEISEEDAKAEGVEMTGSRWQGYGELRDESFESARCSFWSLWDSINAKRGFGWDKNPYVWVIEFRRVTG